MASTCSVARTVKLCRWQVRVNSLWLWWYGAMVLAMQGYLLFRAVTKCKEYNELPWRTRDKPVLELYVYIALIVISVMCVPFFVITTIFKIGNYANDGVRLGKDNIHESEIAEAAGMNVISGSAPVLDDAEVDEITHSGPSGSGNCGGRTLQTIWRHLGPLNHGFHIVSAFCLLLPSILLPAQMIKYGFTSPDVMWWSELDIFFGRHVLKATVSSMDLVQYNPRTNDSIQLDPTEPSTSTVPDLERSWTAVVSPEYVNYVVALLIYALRYAAVFWYTKMAFSLVFSFVLIVFCVHFAFSFCGVGILYKLRVNQYAFPEMNLLLSPTAVMVLYLLANFFLLISALAVFNYGYYHYDLRWKKFLRMFAPTYARTKHAPMVCCQGYMPHLMATILLLLVVGCRAVIVYDSVLVYRSTGFIIILTCIVMDVFYMVAWLSVWFGLTVKQRWDVKIMLARYMVIPNRSSRAGHVSRRDAHARDSTIISGNTPTSDENNGSSPDNLDDNNDPGMENVLMINTNDPADQQRAHSPTGVLRRTKERRTASPQRVKFDESAKKAREEPPDSMSDEPNSQKRKRRINFGQGEGDANDGHNDGVVRRNHSDASRFGGDSTPENTLTRTYRHSIRDKCGQYYRDSRDISPPPAAQSSPLPQEKQPPSRLSPRATNSEEILLNPVRVGAFPDNSHLSPIRGPYSTGNYIPDGEHVPRRLPPRGRLPRAIHDSARNSYPPASPPDEPHIYANSALSHLTPPPPYEPRRPARHSLHVDLPSQALGHSYIEPPSQSLSHLPSSVPPFPQRSKPPVPLPPQYQPKRPPEKPPRDVRVTDKNKPRDIRIKDKNKPNLSRRDSALPSSNETSSNDSEDVLCSQV